MDNAAISSKIDRILNDLEKLTNNFLSLEDESKTNTERVESIKEEIVIIRSALASLQNSTGKHERAIYGENGLVGILEIVQHNATGVTSLLQLEQAKVVAKKAEQETVDNNSRKLKWYGGLVGLFFAILQLINIAVNYAQQVP